MSHFARNAADSARVTGIRWALGPALAGLALIGTAAPARAAFVNYDDFSLSYIHPARWYGEEGKQYGGVRTEAQRSIVSGQLRIQGKGYSDNYSDENTSSIRNSVVFQKSYAVTAIRATLTPRTITAGKCDANATPTATRGRIFGFFFNAGTPTPGSNYNDVYAGIHVARASNSTDDTGVLRVTSYIGICTDDNCIGSKTLAVNDMGTTTVGTPVTLQITWDPAHDRFIFRRDAEALVYTAYTVADTQPASFPAKRLEVSNNIAHCTASRVAANAVVDFDNVQTNDLSGALAVPMQPAMLRTQAVDPVIGDVN